MTEKETEQECGGCVWWEPNWYGSYRGVCMVPLPQWVVEAQTDGDLSACRYYDEGYDCCLWQDKELVK